MAAAEKIRLLDNSRFYILMFSILTSVMIIAGLRLLIPSEQLWYIRTEQIFGFCAIVYLYIALIISPLTYMFGKERLAYVVFARRAIGVSAAYFALLHGSFALFGQLGGMQGFFYLPAFFQWALLLGGVGLIVLLLMAATSFDVVQRLMTYRRWKLLHRLVYLGSILILLHIWMIGTHASSGLVQLGFFIPLAVLFGLEAYRLAALLARRFTELERKDYFVTLLLSIWGILLALLIATVALVDNYHESRHESHAQSLQEATHE